MEELEQPTNIEGSKQEFGKFKDAESLMKAYANLESEFTKKSQRLAMLENEKETEMQKQTKHEELTKKVDEFITKFEAVKPFSSALKETLASQDDVKIEEAAIKILSDNYKSAQQFAEDSEFLNNYIYSNKEIKDNIIKEYLSKITQNTPIKVDNSATSIPLSPPNIPSTILEAGKLAKTIIKNK